MNLLFETISILYLIVIVPSNGEKISNPFNETCVRNTYPPSGRPKISEFVIDLDMDPQHRWDILAKEKSSQVGPILDIFSYDSAYASQSKSCTTLWLPIFSIHDYLLGKFREFIYDVSGQSDVIINLIHNNLGILADTLPQPYRDEMKGIAKVTKLPLGEVVMYNIFYEIFTVCTSIIAQDTSGKLYRGRNLDFGLFLGWDAENHTWTLTETLRPAIVKLEWKKEGKTLFKSVNYAGYVGLLTAVKKGAFSLTLNERFNIDGGYVGILKWILGDRSASWMGFLTRRVLEEATSYTQARNMLMNSPMLAPAYFILGGNKSHEACIITRSRSKAVDVWDIETRSSSWYILETNYDNWVEPMALDDRRTPAHKCMQKLTQKNVGFAGLFDVLSSKPILNKLTTYTALMNVGSGSLEAFLQYCPDPCFPF